jgi:hypothetical protein
MYIVQQHTNNDRPQKKICCRISDFPAVPVRMQPKNCISQCLCTTGPCIILPQATGLSVRWFAVMGMDREKEMARELDLIDILYSDNL